MRGQPHDPKLPDGFFGCGDNVFLANEAPKVDLLALFDDKRRKRPQLVATERFQRRREIIASKKIQKFHPAPHQHGFVRLRRQYLLDATKRVLSRYSHRRWRAANSEKSVGDLP
jgi:hypothetical protein